MSSETQLDDALTRFEGRPDQFDAIEIADAIEGQLRERGGKVAEAPLEIAEETGGPGVQELRPGRTAWRRDPRQRPAENSAGGAPVVEVIARERKSPILTASSLPCLRNVATVNMTEGCALGCRYCYIQGYSHYPGANRVVLYVNSPEVVARELRHKRKKPQRVYLSPSSDAFQYLPQVQDVSRRTMAVLLGAEIEVAFLTKGFITRPFLELFANHAERVFAQIGFTTLDRGLWQRFEPRTAPPHMRVAAIDALISLGIHTTVRLDPLIPGLTDSDDNLLPLLRALTHAGIREAAASYLFLRPRFARQIEPLISTAPAPRAGDPPWRYQEFADGSGGGTMLPPDERAKRLARLEALGRSLGIRIRSCRCKNPEFTAEPCGITGPTPPAGAAPPAQSTFGFDGSEPS